MFKESDMTYPVKEYIELNYENPSIYIEVDNAPCGGRPDMVIKSNDDLHIIELKKTVNIDLLQQCINRLGRCKTVTAVVGTPITKPLWIELFRNYGVGLMTINMKKYMTERYYNLKDIKIHVKPSVDVSYKDMPYSSSTLLERWSNVLHDSFLIENNPLSGINRNYLTQKQVVTEEYFKGYRDGRYHLPEDECLIRYLEEYSTNPIAMSNRLIKENLHLFNVKTENRRKLYQLNKSMID